MQEQKDPVARTLAAEFEKCAHEPKALPEKPQPLQVSGVPKIPSAPPNATPHVPPAVVESPPTNISRQSSFAGVHDMLNRSSTGDVGISPPIPGIKPTVATYGITPPEVPAPSSPVPTVAGSVRGGRTDAQRELHNRRMRFYRSLDSKGLSLFFLIAPDLILVLQPSNYAFLTMGSLAKVWSHLLKFAPWLPMPEVVTWLWNVKPTNPLTPMIWPLKTKIVFNTYHQDRVSTICMHVSCIYMHVYIAYYCMISTTQILLCWIPSCAHAQRFQQSWNVPSALWKLDIGQRQVGSISDCCAVSVDGEGIKDRSSTLDAKEWYSIQIWIRGHRRWYYSIQTQWSHAQKYLC